MAQDTIHPTSSDLNSPIPINRSKRIFKLDGDPLKRERSKALGIWSNTSLQLDRKGNFTSYDAAHPCPSTISILPSQQSRTTASTLASGRSHHVEEMLCHQLLKPIRYLNKRRRCSAFFVIAVASTFLLIVNFATLRSTHVAVSAPSSTPRLTPGPHGSCRWNASAIASPLEPQPQEFTGTLPTTMAPTQDGDRQMFVNLPASAARLGNQMFAHAAMLGVAYCTGFQPVVSRASLTNGHLLETFSLTSTPVVRNELHSAVHWSAPKTSIFTPPENMEIKVENAESSSAVELCGYFQSWRYFADVPDRVIADFQFQPPIMKAASDIIKRVLVEHVDKNETNSQLRYVLVGVHARRGDMSAATQLSRGYRVADEKYFANAMEYVEKRILDKTPAARIIYVVCSDEPSWSQANIVSKRFAVHHSNSNDFGSTAVDLATLASCDHVITSTGTFSWWAGYLAKGRRATTDDVMVIYYASFPPPETEIGSGFLASDYYPPSWIGLT